MVGEVGLPVGRRRGNGGRPARSVVVRAQEGDLLAAELRIRVAEPAVVDDAAARPPEGAAAAALLGADVQRRIAAGDATDRVEAGQVAAAPGGAVVGRAVVRGGGPSRRERAGAREGSRRAKTEVEAELVVRACDQHVGPRIARDRRLVLLVLREREAVIEIDVDVRNGRDGRDVARPAGGKRAAGRHQEKRERQHREQPSLHRIPSL